MATYYVRTDGNDGNAGTGPAAANAWLTIGKALGAAGIASGDTVYIAPGTYRESVTVAMTSATVETLVIGDVSASQFTDLLGGDVISTAYVTNDKTAPVANQVFRTNDRDFLTFRNIIFVGGISNVVLVDSGSTNVKFTRCTFLGSGRLGGGIEITVTVDVASNVTVENCIVDSISGTTVTVNIPTSASADYDSETIIRNCLLTGSAGPTAVPSGVGAFKGGGMKVYNCTIKVPTAASAVRANGVNVASSAGNQCEAYNNICFGVMQATTLGQIVGDYNWICAQTTYSNVTAGANDIATTTTIAYALLVDVGQSVLNGRVSEPWMTPMLSSPFLGFGNDASAGVQTLDLYGYPRPSGGRSALKAIGAMEKPNTFSRETGTVRTGVASVSITGAGVQDFQLPVDTASTTVTVYVQWDATYAGTKPQMVVLNGEECGVATATATATGSSGSWEQLSLTFTATRIGIVTVRLQSNDTNGAGHMYADDFSVT